MVRNREQCSFRRRLVGNLKFSILNSSRLAEFRGQECPRHTRRQKLGPKITSVLKLFRVQDARAALPQNCSPTKVNLGRHSAYGTSVPLSPRESVNPPCH